MPCLSIDQRVAGATAVAGGQHILCVCEGAASQLHTGQVHRTLHQRPGLLVIVPTIHQVAVVQSTKCRQVQAG